MTCLFADVKIKLFTLDYIMDSADKLHNELMKQAFEKWNSLKPALNQAQIDFVEKEIEKQENSI